MKLNVDLNGMKKKERESVESLFLGKKRCINTVQVDKELYNLVLSDLLSDGHCFQTQSDTHTTSTASQFRRVVRHWNEERKEHP